EGHYSVSATLRSQPKGKDKKMHSSDQVGRRVFLVGGAAVIAGGCLFEGLTAENQVEPDKGVTAPEDVMKEHGVLNRCLLIYEEGMRRLERKEQVSPDVFNQTAELVRKFVEEYHEKN